MTDTLGNMTFGPGVPKLNLNAVQRIVIKKREPQM